MSKTLIHDSTRLITRLARLLPALAVCLLCQPAASGQELFHTADRCLACHNGLVTPSGEDVSMGFSWRPTMMANSSRDPYWQAAVRRETRDHPQAQAVIEDECAACHMPMSRYQAKVAGKMGQIFANLPVTQANTPVARLAADGVSCSACHQITAEGLGSHKSFTGGFVIDTSRPLGQRRIFGPYAVEAGLARIMSSSAEFEPQQAKHIQSAELCASCHTLYTHALGPGGKQVGVLPEQVPYLEWRESAYKGVQSCQDCHMPVVEREVPIASVLGQPRAGFSRHVFRGGNFFMSRLFSRYRVARGVAALPQELDAAARRTLVHLQQDTAQLTIEQVTAENGVLAAEVAVSNLAGHKLPTAYPSRRAWLHVIIRDGAGRVLLESGAVDSRGKIMGNDNDRDARRYEPHYEVVDSPDKVQIYEAIMVDHAGAVTTGLLSGLRYIKDNRLLPEGFDKAKVPADVAVQGAAEADNNFAAGGDRVSYQVSLAGTKGPYQIKAELYYQPIGFRWAQNLGDYKSTETTRFVRYYESLAHASSAVLARAEKTTTALESFHPQAEPSETPAIPPTQAAQPATE